MAYMYIAAERRDLAGLTEDASPPELAGLSDQGVRAAGSFDERVIAMTSSLTWICRDFSKKTRVSSI